METQDRYVAIAEIAKEIALTLTKEKVITFNATHSENRSTEHTNLFCKFYSQIYDTVKNKIDGN